jgi:hypothetical protein
MIGGADTYVEDLYFFAGLDSGACLNSSSARLCRVAFTYTCDESE